MKARIAAALVAALALFALFTIPASATQPDPSGNHQVWVCKYVGQPGDFETLKPGKNPIIVDVAAADAYVGADFADGQTHSLVIDLATDANTGQGEKYTGDASCPSPTPSDAPSDSPSASPSTQPSPRDVPSDSPSPEPSVSPTPGDSDAPSTVPSKTPDARVMPPTDTEETPLSPSATALLIYGAALAASLVSWAYLDARKRGR